MQLIQFILGIALLILVHEIGHFIAARFFKVEVEEFGIGFPPRAVTLFRHKGTAFTLNMIPLGGFVRPKGENDPTVAGGLAASKPWVRVGVYFAGPLMNLAVGVLLGTLLFYNLGDPINEKVLIRHIAPNSPAEQAGLQPEDIFISVAGQNVDSIEKLQTLISENLGQSIEIVIQRGEQTVKVSLTPRPNPPQGEGPVGVVLDNPTRPISFFTAINRGIQATYQNIRGLFLLPVRLLQGQLQPEEGRVVGYKGMYDIYQQLQSPLLFFMVISISLGVINLFPIPALDGGRILLTLPEILIRRRIPAKYENLIHMIGFSVLVLLLIYVNILDFIKPIQLPK